MSDPYHGSALQVQTGDAGEIKQVVLYGRPLLDTDRPCGSELWVNGKPLSLRSHVDPHDPTRTLRHLKGEHYVNHFSGWGLVVSRRLGERAAGCKHPCLGIQTSIRREICDQTLPTPGPGGPVVEAPLYVDTLGVLHWNWSLWGADTRMLFTSLHGTGPDDEYGHVGHEHAAPAEVKRYLKNVWRRIYPGTMLVHGGVFYDAKSGQWLAITCRRPSVGYILNITDSGLGVSYDFTLHAQFALGESVTLPEIKIYYGPDRESMMSWLADYASFYYEEPPAWVFRTVFGGGLAWNNKPTWSDQADHWLAAVDRGDYSGIGYSLVTNRPVRAGTTPLGYEPDPNHGTLEEFRRMCHRLADRDIPLLIWMSHSGLCYRGGNDIDDDWFIRGIDGRICASWGSLDHPELAHINPGHPGYIEYTKKWIRFYLQECRCRGIFFDCLGWAFPPDFRQRSFMRYPGDTNLMAIRFINEIYAEIKRINPDAILLGEGATLDAPVNVLAVASNPIRTNAVDGLGPRDFLLSLNGHGSKRFVTDQHMRHFAGGGYCHIDDRDAAGDHNRFLTKFLAQHGSRATTHPLPHDLSIMEALDETLLVVPPRSERSAQSPQSFSLPTRWSSFCSGKEVIRGTRIASEDGVFVRVSPGIYKLR